MGEHRESGIYLEWLNEPVQCRGTMEAVLLYCIKGSFKAKISGHACEFFENDIVVVNANEPYEIVMSDDAAVCRIVMDYGMLVQEAGGGAVNFCCNSRENSGVSYDELRHILERLVEEYALGAAQNFRKKELFYRLLVCLMNRYVREFRSKTELLMEDALIARTLSYISENLTSNVTLKAAAALNFMSESAFSKYFKRNMGINFSEYVGQMRMERARQALKYTRRTMTQIAQDCGYSNASVFTKAFRQTQGCTPSAYRQRCRAAGETIGPERAKGPAQPFKLPLPGPELKGYAAWRREHGDSEAARLPARRLSIDSRRMTAHAPVWNQCINIGTAASLLSGRLSRQLLMLKEALGFRYVRISNLFSSEMQLREGAGYDRLNFENVDTVLDFIVSHGMHPMIEAGDKPRRAVRSSSQLLFFEDAGTVFHSAQEMQSIYTQFIRHITLRYGVEEAEQWIFENWYDSRSSRADVPYDYLDTFDILYDIIKTALPGARVGGCGLELGGPVPDFLGTWKDHRHLPDFISFCAFPYRREVSGLKAGDAVRSGDIHFMRRELERVSQMLQDCGLGGIDLYLTEWNLSISDRNYFNDCCGKGALMLHTMKELDGLIKMGVFWYASDMSTSYYDTQAFLFGGSGLLSRDGLKKPAFFALDFIGRLGRFWMEAGENCIAAANGRQSFDLLLFNDKHLNYSYYLKNEDAVSVEDTKYIFENDDCLKIEVTLGPVAPGSYFIRTESISPEHGNLLGEWLGLGDTRALSMNDVKYLRQICVPKLYIRRQTAALQSKDNGAQAFLTITQVLKAHEMCLLHIYPDEICMGGS